MGSRFDRDFWICDVQASITAMDNPTMEQDSFRFRNDDGSESAATWKAAVNTDVTITVSGNTAFRIRFLVQETAGNASVNFKPQLQRQLNAGGFVDVTGTSGVIRAVDSANLTDGEDTTQQIGAGTFITNNDGVDEVNGVAGSAKTDFVGNDETEFEYSVEIVDADVADSDTVDLRISDANIDSYAVADGTITVSKVSVTQQTIAATAVGYVALSTVITFVKGIAATAAGVVALTRGVSFLKTITATTVGTAALGVVPTFVKVISAVATGVATVSASRLILKAISAVASGVVSLSKAPTFTRAIAATATGVASLTRALTFMRAVAATAIGAGSLSTVTTFVKAIAATAVGAAALVANLIGGAGAAAAKLRRRIGRLIVNPGTLLRR